MESKWEAEKATFGWLGEFPPELAHASMESVRRWKELSKRAAGVVKMRPSEARVRAAKEIEVSRTALIETIRMETSSRR